MKLKEKREKMNKILKAIVVPRIREMGFSGSFPHFRRENNNGIQLIMFQYNPYGGSFVVEVGKCSKEGVTYANGRHISSDKVTRVYQALKRLRLGSEPKKGTTDHWFDYDSDSFLDSKTIYEQRSQGV